MPIYNQKIYMDTLMWDDIFESAEEMEMKFDMFVNDKDKLNFMPYDDLYYILMLKYANSHTRYTDEYSFIRALIRELRVVWPIYKAQQGLMEQARDMELSAIQKRAQQIRNIVDNPNELNDKMDTKAISNTSTLQESMVNLGNEMDAIRTKYNVITQNYLEKVYNAINPLFKQILSDDVSYIYPRGNY